MRELKDMFRKYASLALVALLLNLTFYSTTRANADKDAKFAAKVKTEITKLGTGTDAHIRVKLRDKTKIKGFVSESNEDYFVVVDEKTGIGTPVTYSKGKQLKGHNLSSGKIVAAVIILTLAIAYVMLTIAKEDD